MKRILFAVMLSVVAYGCTTTQQTQTSTTTSTTETTDPNRPRYTISVTQKNVSLGNIVIELFANTAPKHVRNFDSLVSVGFYNGTAFHRVIPNFMIQGGDPNSRTGSRDSWGTGAPGQTKVPAEFSAISHTRGILSAARTNDPNSATSQFFICVADVAHLDGKYTAYGQVISGMEVVDNIVSAPRDQRDNPTEKVEMKITKNK